MSLLVKLSLLQRLFIFNGLHGFEPYLFQVARNVFTDLIGKKESFLHITPSFLALLAFMNSCSALQFNVHPNHNKDRSIDLIFSNIPHFHFLYLTVAPLILKLTLTIPLSKLAFALIDQSYNQYISFQNSTSTNRLRGPK